MVADVFPQDFFMTVSVTSDTKKAVGINEIKKNKKSYGQYKNKAAQILQFSLFFSGGVFGWFGLFFFSLNKAPSLSFFIQAELVMT